MKLREYLNTLEGKVEMIAVNYKDLLEDLNTGITVTRANGYAEIAALELMPAWLLEGTVETHVCCDSGTYDLTVDITEAYAQVLTEYTEDQIFNDSIEAMREIDPDFFN